MFELFFKYPRSVYARGHFALLAAWPAWVLVLLIAAAAVGLAWLIRSRLAHAASIMRSWRAWVIWGLQTLLAAMVLVLLWQPAITVAELKPQQNIIAVLVDDSRSMAITENGVTRQAQAVKALQNGVLDSLNRSFQTRLYRVRRCRRPHRQSQGSATERALHSHRRQPQAVDRGNFRSTHRRRGAAQRRRRQHRRHQHGRHQRATRPPHSRSHRGFRTRARRSMTWSWTTPYLLRAR